MTTAAAARRSLKAREKRRGQNRRRHQRLREQAKALHTKLVGELGGICMLCQEDGTNAPLSIDHINGIGWDKAHNKYNSVDRVRRYYKEYQAGVPLRVLCVPCNSGYRPVSALDYPAAPF